MAAIQAAISIALFSLDNTVHDTEGEREGGGGERRRERERECLLISQRGTEVLSSYNRKLNAHRCVYNTAFYDLATMVYRPDSKRASSPLCPEKALKRTLEKYQGSISRHKIIRLL